MKAKNVKLAAEHFRQHCFLGQNVFASEDERRGYEMALGNTAENLATILKLDNPKFDRDKFIKECGL